MQIKTTTYKVDSKEADTIEGKWKENKEQFTWGQATMDIGWQLRRRRRHAVPGVPEIGNLNGFWNHFQCPSDHLYQKRFQFSLLSTKLCYCGQNCASDDEWISKSSKINYCLSLETEEELVILASDNWWHKKYNPETLEKVGQTKRQHSVCARLLLMCFDCLRAT